MKTLNPFRSLKLLVLATLIFIAGSCAPTRPPHPPTPPHPPGAPVPPHP
ncbi:MAG TPA: hypothetical protein VGC22_10785 [Chitinophaga sp.]